GTPSAARNVISGNGFAGVRLSQNGGTNNIIEGNYIGTDATGMTALPNYIGIQVGNSVGPTIGGIVPGAGNVVSGNQTYGIDVVNSTLTTIQGNNVGTDATGIAALGNGSIGILDLFSSNNTIGGTIPAAANVIMANGYVYPGSGVQLSGTGDVLEGNYIGTNALGLAGFGNNTDGVLVTGSNNTIGGTIPGAGNVIDQNNGAGVDVTGGATGNRIQGNAI